MRQKSPKLGKKKPPYHDGATGDVLGMEMVPQTKRQGQKIEGMEMRMLRFALAITRKDKIRNEVVRKTMKVESLLGKLREWSLRWKDHISRKEDTYHSKVVQQVKVGKRKTDRGKRWRDCIKSDMEAMGTT